jgi:hypothetical protein
MCAVVADPARAVNPSLLVYQEVRKSRAEHVVASASQNRYSLHLPDGPEQARRDDLIARASAGESVNPDLWCAPSSECQSARSHAHAATTRGDKDFQKYVWGQDVQAQTIARYDDLLIEALAKKAMCVCTQRSWLRRALTYLLFAVTPTPPCCTRGRVRRYDRHTLPRAGAFPRKCTCMRIHNVLQTPRASNHLAIIERMEQMERTPSLASHYVTLSDRA